MGEWSVHPDDGVHRTKNGDIVERECQRAVYCWANEYRAGLRRDYTISLSDQDAELLRKLLTYFFVDATLTLKGTVHDHS